MDPSTSNKHAASAHAHRQAVRRPRVNYGFLHVPQQPDSEQDDAWWLTDKEMLAAYQKKYDLCTCSQGVPSWLCRVVHCYAFEIGTCNPAHVNWRWRHNPTSQRWCRDGCSCIPWDSIINDPEDLRCNGAFDADNCPLGFWGEAREISWRGPRVSPCQRCVGSGGRAARMCARAPMRHAADQAKQ